MPDLDEATIKEQVREFYDRVGWQQMGEGLYQNARYEDLRPVSQEYIQRCHQRVSRALGTAGNLLLDAGSGPVQYPDYLAYSQGYRQRVCADLSITALKEARLRLGEHGWYVVCDIARLPFKAQAFDGIVSLHAVHHVPYPEQPKAYGNLYRVLKPGRSAAIVNAWNRSSLMTHWQWLVRSMDWLMGVRRRLSGGKTQPPVETSPTNVAPSSQPATGTYTRHYDANTLLAELARLGVPAELRPWRSLSVRFLRVVIHPRLAGRAVLKLVYWLEERYPTYFGRNGQYPLIILRKPQQEKS